MYAKLDAKIIIKQYGLVSQVLKFAYEMKTSHCFGCCPNQVYCSFVSKLFLLK